MTARTDEPTRARARSMIVAGFVALSAITLVSTASTTGASSTISSSSSTEHDDDSTTSTSDDSTTSSDASTTSDETSTTVDDGDDGTTSSDASTTSSTDASTTSAPTGTATPAGTVPPAPTDFAAVLAAECEGDTGQPLLASALRDAIGADGSQRIVEILETCDAEFVGEINPELGRPSTNVERLIADPANDVTPNQAQVDLLNAELTIVWRIADAWAQSQATTTTLAGSEDTSTTASTATSTSDVSTTTAEGSSTTT